MKNIVRLCLCLLFLSCNVDNSSKIQVLEKENDSLKAILKNKFIFDNASFRIIPTHKKSRESGTDFVGEVVMVGFNNEDVLIYGDYDISHRKFIKSDTIRGRQGAYEFNTDGKQSEVDFYVQIKSVYNSKTYDSILTYPYESLLKLKE